MDEEKTSQLCFRVTKEEHHKLKLLAVQTKKTFKDLFFLSLDIQFPDWREKHKN